MDNIEISIRNLMKTNNGAFKSEKQASFLLSQTVGLEYCVAGNSFNKYWTDVFSFDEKGVVSLHRHNRGGSVVEKWNRNGDSKTQIKNAKSLQRHNAKVDAHNALSIDAEKLFNRLCLAEFGYIADRDLMDKCWSSISTMENTRLVDVIFKETNMHMFRDELNIDQIKQCNDLIEIYNENLDAFNQYKNMYALFSRKVLDIRCKVYETYPTKFPYSFM